MLINGFTTRLFLHYKWEARDEMNNITAIAFSVTEATAATESELRQLYRERDFMYLNACLRMYIVQLNGG